MQTFFSALIDKIQVLNELFENTCLDSYWSTLLLNCSRVLDTKEDVVCVLSCEPFRIQYTRLYYMPVLVDERAALYRYCDIIDQDSKSVITSQISRGLAQYIAYIHSWLRVLVQVTIYRRLWIGRDGHLDQSKAYYIS